MMHPTFNHREYVKDRAQRLDSHAIEIGRLCMAWSSLELDTTLLLSGLANFSSAHTKNILLGTMDLRQKISAIRALGFANKPDSQWYELLASTLSEIDDPIRSERNRMIHDFWTEVPNSSGATDIRRAQITPKVVNTQSRTRELRLVNVKPVTAQDIIALCQDIYRVNATILDLLTTYEERAPVR